MMSSSLGLFFLLCFSVHACSACRLSFVTEEAGYQDHFLSKEDNDEVSLQKSGGGWPFILEKLHESSVIGTKTMKQKLLKAFSEAKEAVLTRAVSGYEGIVSPQDDLRGATKMEGLKREARFLLGSSRGDTEEAVGPEETDTAEDIVVMDYAQPHRKPPIHNEKS